MENIEDNKSDEPLLSRIRGEFLEMPGLRLSREQAQRLCGLDAPTCVRVLDRLVQACFLECGLDGRYGRIGEHRMHRLPIRMAKADIEDEGGGPPRRATNTLRAVGTV